MCGLAPSRILGAIRYAPAAGRRRRSASCRPARCRWSPARRRTARATRPTWAQIVADRLGVDLDDVEVLHGDTAVVPLGHRHLRQPQPRGRRRRPLACAADKVDREGPRRSPPTSSRCAADDLEFADGDVQGEGLARQGDDARRPRSPPGPRTTCPTGMEPGLEATARLRPAELLLAGRRPRRASSRSTRRPATRGSCATSPSTTAAR